MGKLHQIGNIEIRVYGNDHLPPHFHAIGPDFEAFIAIATLDILRGKLAPSARKAVMAWASANQATLAAEWNRLNPNTPFA